MADINRIIPGNPIIPSVQQDKAIGEREKQQHRDGEKESPTDDHEENNGDNEKSGVDYYA